MDCEEGGRVVGEECGLPRCPDYAILRGFKMDMRSLGGKKFEQSRASICPHSWWLAFHFPINPQK